MNKENKNQVRVRIAPSPTGPFHFGTARTALYNYLFAKHHKGKFILRIEDTDKKRSEKKFEKDIIDSLKWLGLQWDEGPYRQSKRTKIYQKYIEQLLHSGQAFWCYHTKEELEKEKKEQISKKQAPRHDCSYYGKEKQEREGIIRFRCPKIDIIFNDLIRGRVEFDAKLLGDISVAKDEKTPLYNLAVVIDDHKMKISHVIRGEDHLSNTPKQILLYEALGFDLPKFGHLPLILGTDRSKMSKRHGETSFSWYRKQGFLPEALNNFMALLGWNLGTKQEVFSLDELVKKFSLDRVHKGGAVFDIKKLEWLNGHYIRKMNLDELTKKCIPYLKTLPKNFDYLKKIVGLEQERLKKLSEIGELTNFFFQDELKYSPSLLVWKKMDLKQVKNNLKAVEKIVSKIKNFDKKSLEESLASLREKEGTGEVLWPLRVALTGKKASPGPFEIMEVLGKEKTLKRIKKAISLL